MRYIVCIFLFLNNIYLRLDAQTNYVPGQSNFSTGIVFTPEAIFLGNLPEQVKLGNRISCSYGLNIRYSFVKNWSITTGIHGSNKVFMAYVNVYDRHNNFEGSFKKKSSYAFVEMPLILSYEREYNKRVSIYASAGGVIGYLSHEKVADPGAHTPDILYDGKTAYLYQFKAYVYDRSDLDDFGYYKYLLSSYLGIGALIKLDSKVSILVQPNFKYAITNMHKKEPSKFPLQYSGRPYSFGLMAGFLVRI